MTEISFGAAADVYLLAVRADYERVASWKRIAVSLRALSGYVGDLTLSKLSADDIEDFKRMRLGEVKAVTVRHDLINLGLFLRHAQGKGWIEADPLKGVRIPSDRDAVHIRVVSEEEERRYLTAARSNFNLYALARLTLAVGLRPGEARMLRIVDYVRREAIRIRGGKSRAAKRTLRLVGDVVDVVDELAGKRGPEEFLFPGRRVGHPAAMMNNTHHDTCIRAGLVNGAGRREIRIYDFRHTFATRMAARGMPLTTLAAILGHSNLRCVMCYVHPSQAAMDDALLQFAR